VSKSNKDSAAERFAADGGFPAIVHSHATSWHDGGVALLTRSGEIVALAAERVRDRFKHSYDSRLAYEYLRERDEYRNEFENARDRFISVEQRLSEEDHHRFHAACAFFGSGFGHAAVLVVDGQGCRGDHIAPTSIWCGSGSALEPVEELFPTHEDFADHSLGHFYTAVGALAGMTDQYEEGKTMALAAYGGPSPFLEWLRERVRVEPDGRYWIEPDFVRAVLGHTLVPKLGFRWDPPSQAQRELWEEIARVRGRPIRPGEPDQVDMDTAFAGQAMLEELLLGLARRAHTLTGAKRLCVVGGVALNCVANERLVREGPFEEVFVPPAPSDDGQALGKLLLEIEEMELPVETTMRTAYLGPAYDSPDFEEATQMLSEDATLYEGREDELIERVVSLLAAGKVVALCQGRSELGPRALGHRSIVADPRSPEMREHLNRRVKHREPYRPLAPMVTEERVSEFFELEGASPFMTRAVMVRADKRSVIPAVTHVDGSARVQTISAEQDLRCHLLLRAFERSTGIPVLLNTSFNDRGEPLVETPADAAKMFLRMRIDALLIGKQLAVKEGTVR
jgi:carbamoyltransferase